MMARFLDPRRDELEQLVEREVAAASSRDLVQRSHAIDYVTDIALGSALERDEQAVSRYVRQDREEHLPDGDPSPHPFSRIRNSHRHSSLGSPARNPTGVNQFPPGSDQRRYQESTEPGLRFFPNREACATAAALEVQVLGTALAMRMRE